MLPKVAMSRPLKRRKPKDTTRTLCWPAVEFSSGRYPPTFVTVKGSGEGSGEGERDCHEAVPTTMEQNYLEGHTWLYQSWVATPCPGRVNDTRGPSSCGRSPSLNTQGGNGPELDKSTTPFRNSSQEIRHSHPTIALCRQTSRPQRSFQHPTQTRIRVPASCPRRGQVDRAVDSRGWVRPARAA